jgi:hypothetical protein
MRLDLEYESPTCHQRDIVDRIGPVMTIFAALAGKRHGSGD